MKQRSEEIEKGEEGISCLLSILIGLTGWVIFTLIIQKSLQFALGGDPMGFTLSLSVLLGAIFASVLTVSANLFLFLMVEK